MKQSYLFHLVNSKDIKPHIKCNIYLYDVTHIVMRGLKPNLLATHLLPIGVHSLATAASRSPHSRLVSN